MDPRKLPLGFSRGSTVSQRAESWGLLATAPTVVTRVSPSITAVVVVLGRHRLVVLRCAVAAEVRTVNDLHSRNIHTLRRSIAHLSRVVRWLRCVVCHRSRSVVDWLRYVVRRRRASAATEAEAHAGARTVAMVAGLCRAACAEHDHRRQETNQEPH